MTREIEIVNAGTPFGRWMRQFLMDSHQGLSITDIDTIVYVLNEYKKNIIMLIEEKASGDTVHNGQGLTLGVLSTMLSVAARIIGIEFWGLHVLRMQNTTPENSQWIRWDGKQITAETLKKFLNFEKRP